MKKIHQQYILEDHVTLGSGNHLLPKFTQFIIRIFLFSSNFLSKLLFIFFLSNRNRLLTKNNKSRMTMIIFRCLMTLIDNEIFWIQKFKVEREYYFGGKYCTFYIDACVVKRMEKGRERERENVYWITVYQVCSLSTQQTFIFIARVSYIYVYLHFQFKYKWDLYLHMSKTYNPDCWESCIHRPFSLLI